jgi:hypothetical protein
MNWFTFGLFGVANARVYPSGKNRCHQAANGANSHVALIEHEREFNETSIRVTSILGSISNDRTQTVPGLLKARGSHTTVREHREIDVPAIMRDFLMRRIRGPLFHANAPPAGYWLTPSAFPFNRTSWKDERWKNAMAKSIQKSAGVPMVRARVAVAFVFTLLTALVGTQSLAAQRFTAIHSFSGSPDGSGPAAGLSRGTNSGVFFGTTESGGMFGEGTVFTVNREGKVHVVYSFCQLANCGCHASVQELEDAIREFIKAHNQ